MGVIERITDAAPCSTTAARSAKAHSPRWRADRQVQEAYLGVARWRAGSRSSGVYTAYDKADVLQGVSLTVAARQHHLPARLQRLGQDHADPLDPRADPAARRAHRVRRRRHHRLPTHRCRGRHRLHPGRPQGVSQAHGRGEPARRRLPGSLGGGDAHAHCRDLRDLSRGCRAPRAARRHDVGRRAGHGVDRTRADARAEAPAHRRAVARPLPDPGEGKLQHHPRDQRARHHSVSGRAERAPDPRHLAATAMCCPRARGRSPPATPAELSERDEVREAYFG